jgi:hypothetical protein
MNDLKQAFQEHFAAYSTSLESYLVTKRSKAGKSIRLPLLDRQLMGTLVQYKFPWNQRMKDADSCHCCQHSLTMAVESQAGINTKNRELRTKASTNGGNGKFEAVSALHGCYCYLNNCHGHQGGYGCTECMRKAAEARLWSIVVRGSADLIASFAVGIANVCSWSTTGRRLLPGS